MCLAYNCSQEMVVSITHELNEVMHMKSRVSNYYEFTWLSTFFFWLFMFFSPFSWKKKEAMFSLCSMPISFGFSLLRNGHSGFYKGLNWSSFLENYKPVFFWFDSKKEREIACFKRGYCILFENGIKFYTGNSTFPPSPTKNGLLK